MSTELEEFNFHNFKLNPSPIRISEDWSTLDDADEEVFIIYSRLASKKVQDGSEAFNGLGFVNVHQDILTIPFNVPSNGTKKIRRGKKRSASWNDAGIRPASESAYDIVEVELAQDKTALQSRKGDTGSVLWKLSVILGQLFLNQVYFRPTTGLFDPQLLSNCHVLELGGGTGLLSIILSPWVEQYTITDLDSLIPLIRKNISLNSMKKFPHLAEQPRPNISVESLDWLHLLRTRQPMRPSIFRLTVAKPIDIIFVVDCIFNPSLLDALVETIDHFSIPGRTQVVVALELRADDVVREFLNLWLNKEDWRIWRINEDMANELYLDPSYLIWVGMKTATVAQTNATGALS